MTRGMRHQQVCEGKAFFTDIYDNICGSVVPGIEDIDALASLLGVVVLGRPRSVSHDTRRIGHFYREVVLQCLL